MSILHWIGSKPLMISLLSQVVVFAVAWHKRDKTQLAESGVLATGLSLLIVSILLRPEQPEQLAPDLLGTIAAVTFVVPAVKALSKLREGKKAPGAS